MDINALIANNKIITSSIEEEIDNLLDMASTVKDDYMSCWIGERAIRLSQKKASQSYSEAEVGRMIPRVRMKMGKPVVEWTDQQSPKIKRVNPSFVAVVNPHKTRGYTKDILKKRCDPWEESIVLEYEDKFKLIRKSMLCLHKTKVELAFVLRALEKQLN